MKTFEMPEFYMPYPARCNPHLESARVHAKKWAIQMGMLNSSSGTPGAEVWDEDGFDAMDFGLYAALIYPDASAPELDLLTDWHVWAWFLDDFFPKAFTHKNDLVGGKKYISELAAYMPMDVAGAPAPTNPVEAGLANLWMRTVHTASPDWRARLSDVVQAYLCSTPLEIYNIDHGWTPNPINYVIDVRRRAGGMELVACLIEHAHGVEIPSVVASTRPLRVLKDTFADGVDLRNDILSYQKEALAGEVNGVMIAERFLACDLQRAVDVINDLATSRMQQFENTALIELPLLFEDYLLDPKARLEILSYVKGLQECMAGDLQWAKESVRYKETGSSGEEEPSGSTSDARYLTGPTGIGTAAARFPTSVTASRPVRGANGTERESGSRLLGPTGIGTAAARLGLARRVASVAWPINPQADEGGDASRMELPDFYMPFHVRCNPHLDAARAQTKAWAIEMGMLGSGLADWDETGFESADCARFTALVYPDVSSPALDLASLWCTWEYFLGDFSDEVFQRRRDLAGAKAAFDRLPAFMPIFLTEAVPVPMNPLERGLADLWPRTAPAMSEDWRRAFSRSVMASCEGLLWEILNMIENRLPDPVDYIEMRRQTCGVERWVLRMPDALGLEIPPTVHNAEPMRMLVDATLRWYGLTNDIFSYQREIECEDEIHNGVLIIKRFLGCDLQQAVTLANELATSQLRRFEYIVDAELPALADELSLSPADRENTDRYIRGLQDCIAGLFQAHVVIAASRYGLSTGSHTAPAADTPVTPVAGGLLAGPRGLGTAAARVGSVRTVGTSAPVGPAWVRLSFGPTGIGTAAARIGSARDPDIPEPTLVTEQPPDLPDDCVPDVTAAADPDALGIEDACEIGPESVPDS